MGIERVDRPKGVPNALRSDGGECAAAKTEFKLRNLTGNSLRISGGKIVTRYNLHRFYAVNQIEYCRNFIFKRHFPIHRIFERSCEIGLWRLTAHKISEIFGVRVTKKLKGKLNTTLEQIEHGHHIFRAYFKHAFVKQYEKFSTFLRNEICSNNLSDFGLKKGLGHLAAVRTRFLAITDRFATFHEA